MTPTQHLQKSAEEFRERFADDGTTSKAELKMRAESFWLSKLREAYLIAAEEVEGMKKTQTEDFVKTGKPSYWFDGYNQAIADAANRLRCGIAESI